MSDVTKCESGCDANNGIHTAMCYLRNNQSVAPSVSSDRPSIKSEDVLQRQGQNKWPYRCTWSCPKSSQEAHEHVIVDGAALTIDEAAKEIIRTLRPTDPDSWEANMFYVVARLKSLKVEPISVSGEHVHNFDANGICVTGGCGASKLRGGSPARSGELNNVLPDDLMNCISRLLCAFRNCPLCERAMPGHHTPDCEYLLLTDRVKHAAFGSLPSPAPTDLQVENAGLRRKIHQLEQHNQWFERCESAWCNTAGDSNPALESLKDLVRINRELQTSGPSLPSSGPRPEEKK